MISDIYHMNPKLTIVTLCILLLSSCSKDDSPSADPLNPPVVVDFLDISSLNINFTSEKDASLIVVETDGIWNATTTNDWITLSTNSGNKSTGFIVGASANKKFKREGKITITSGDKTKDIKIIQAGLSKIELHINGVTFKLLPVDADTSFYLDGMTYLATRDVYLDSYYISETEITNAQWLAVVGALPYNDENSMPQLPVIANWKEINENFIAKINKLTDYQLRLPTENEWEVAARGGKKSKNTGYAGSMYIDSVAWYWQNSVGGKQTPALKKPNELGLYDMSGNVSEWCFDWYAEWTDENRPDAKSTNPKGPATGTDRVIRGGDFKANHYEYDQNSCNISSRNHLPPDVSTDNFLYNGYENYTGFRLVISKN